MSVTPATIHMYYANAGVVHSNGSVTPIFTGQAGASVPSFNGITCGGQQMTSGTNVTPVSGPTVATTYVLENGAAR